MHYSENSHTHSHIVLLIDLSAIDDAQTGHGVVCAADGGHARVVMRRAPWRAFAVHAAAAAQLPRELLLEGLAQQVKGEGVEAGVGEGQDTGDDAAHKVNQGRVHLTGERRGMEG